MPKAKERRASAKNEKIVRSEPPYIRTHLQFGWWALLCYLTLGIALETLHGLKIGWYLEAAFEARRLMWTLGHAHGVLLSLVNIAFAATLHLLADREASPRKIASRSLIGATVLLPCGFFLGGIFIHDGDPGIGIFLVPVGAVLLFLGVLLTARTVSRHS